MNPTTREIFQILIDAHIIAAEVLVLVLFVVVSYEIITRHLTNRK